MVTRASAAELSATARRDATVSLGIYSNRYSLTLFMPLACFLLVYGRLLILRWLGGEMAERSAPLLPIFLLSYGLVLAAQFNSSSLLFGVGRHGRYAIALTIEAAAYLAALMWAIPRYGIWGRGVGLGDPHDRGPRNLYAVAGIARPGNLFLGVHERYLRSSSAGRVARAGGGVRGASHRPARPDDPGADPGRVPDRGHIHGGGDIRVYRSASSRAFHGPHPGAGSATRSEPCVARKRFAFDCARNWGTWRCCCVRRRAVPRGRRRLRGQDT